MRAITIRYHSPDSQTGQNNRTCIIRAKGEMKGVSVIGNDSTLVAPKLGLVNGLGLGICQSAIINTSIFECRVQETVRRRTIIGSNTKTKELVWRDASCRKNSPVDCLGKAINPHI